MVHFVHLLEVRRAAMKRNKVLLKRKLSAILTVMLVFTGSMQPVSAAEKLVYTNGFEEGKGGFTNYRQAQTLFREEFKKSLEEVTADESTEELETTIEGAKGSSSGEWGQAVTLGTLKNDGGSFDPSWLEKDCVVRVYYESNSVPELVLQSWSGGAEWAKVGAAKAANGVAEYTYSSMVTAFGTDDFASYLDNFIVGDTGAALTVKSVSIVINGSKSTSQGTVIAGATGTSTGSWGQAVTIQTLKNGGGFDPAILVSGVQVQVTYESEVAPELVLQSWSGGPVEWAKVAASYSDGSTAIYTYDAMVAAFGTDDFVTYLDAFIIGDCGAPLTVSQAVYSSNAAQVESSEEAAIEATCAEAKEGKEFLCVSNRKGAISGTQVDLSQQVKKGKTYQVTAWMVNMGTETDYGSLYFGNGSTIGSLVATERIAGGEWVQLTAIVKVPTNAKKAVLTLDTCNTTNPFGVDLVEVKQVSAQSTSKIKSATLSNSMVKDGAITVENMDYKNLTIDQSIGNNDVVLKNVTVCGTLTICADQVGKISFESSKINKIVVKSADQLLTSAAKEGVTIMSLEDSQADVAVAVSQGRVLDLLTGTVITTLVAQANVELIGIGGGAIEALSVFEPLQSRSNGSELMVSLNQCSPNLITVETGANGKAILELTNSQVPVLSTATSMRGCMELEGDSSSLIQELNLTTSAQFIQNIAVNTMNISGSAASIHIMLPVQIMNVLGARNSILVDTTALVEQMHLNGSANNIVANGIVNAIEVGAESNTFTGQLPQLTFTDESFTLNANGTTYKQLPAQLVTSSSGSEDTDNTPLSNIQLAKNKTGSVTVETNEWSNGDYQAAIDLLTMLNNAGVSSKAKLSKYKYLEVVMHVDKIANTNEETQSSAKIFTQENAGWTWTDSGSIELEEDQTITMRLNISDIKWGEGAALAACGVQLHQYGEKVKVNYELESVTLIYDENAEVETPVEPGENQVRAGEDGQVMLSLSKYVDLDKVTEAITNGTFTSLTLNLTLDASASWAKAYIQDNVAWQWVEGENVGSTSSNQPYNFVIKSFTPTNPSWTKDTVDKFGVQYGGLNANQIVTYQLNAATLVTTDGTSSVLVTGGGTDDPTDGSTDEPTTEVETVIEGAIGSSTGSWGQAVTISTLKNGGSFDSAVLVTGSAIKVTYTSDTAPELILQSWTTNPEKWAQVAPSSNDGSTAVYTYADMVKAFGTNEFSTYLDAIHIGDRGAALTVSKVAYVITSSGGGTTGEGTTEEGTVIEGATGSSDGSWSQAVTISTLKNGGSFNPAVLVTGSAIKVSYASDNTPELVLQSWSGGPVGWAKVAASSSDGSTAVYTYDDMVEAFGTDDFVTYLDAVIVGDCGAPLTVSKVVYVQ